MEDVSDTDVFAALSGDSPPQEKKKRSSTPRTEPRTQSVKRSSSTPAVMPPVPRRGRTRTEMPPKKLLHRQVEADDSTVQMSIQSIYQQLAEDRRHMADLQSALQKMYDAATEKGNCIDMLETRLDEQTRLRFDDHREHVRELTQMPVTIENRCVNITKQLND